MDQGAEHALLHMGRSLLPSGVLRVEGDFPAGSVVAIRGESGQKIAHGISSYSSEDARRILGRHSEEIEGILGVCDFEELVHRNNMALI